MPWTETTRPHYERRCPRYASDLTNAEWALIEPLMPAPNRIGRPRKTDLREVVNALLYMASSGGAWRLLPKDFPPWQTVCDDLPRWEREGVWAKVHHTLVMADRARTGRAPGAHRARSLALRRHHRQPDRQDGGSKGGFKGCDAGKKTHGRKAHIPADTDGRLLAVVAQAEDIQDRDGAKAVLKRSRARFPFVHTVFADGGYAGRLVAWAKDKTHVTLEIVRRMPGVKGFVVIRRRWVVERTFASIMKCRRLARDYEQRASVTETLITIAAAATLVRRWP